MWIVLQINDNFRIAGHLGVNTAMASWHDLPFELKLEILELSIPVIDDTQFRKWVVVQPSDFWYCECMSTRNEEFEQHTQEQFRIMEKLFLICDSWSKGLLSALLRHINDIEDYLKMLDTEIGELPDEWVDWGWCPCCAGKNLRSLLSRFQQWKDFVEYGRVYAGRFLKYCR